MEDRSTGPRQVREAAGRAQRAVRRGTARARHLRGQREQQSQTKAGGQTDANLYIHFLLVFTTYIYTCI